MSLSQTYDRDESSKFDESARIRWLNETKDTFISDGSFSYKSFYTHDEDASIKSKRGAQVLDDDSLKEVKEAERLGLIDKRHREFKANNKYLIQFIIVLIFAGMQIGYCVSYTNQLTKTFIVKFNWRTQAEKDYYKTILGASGILGMAIGAISGGKIIAIGRKKTLLISTCIGMFGVFSSLFLQFEAICIGRCIYGFSAGVYSVTVSRIMDEVLPSHLLTVYCPIQKCGSGLARMLVVIVAAGLPPDNSERELRESEFWRFIVGFPFFFYVITLIGTFFLIKNDTPKYLIINGRMKEAIEAIKVIYDKSEDPYEIAEYIKKTSMKNTIKVSIKESLTDPRYKKATWVLIALTILHEMTGMNAIALYSNSMFEEMNKDGKGLNPRQGTYVIGVVNFLATVGSVFFVKYFPRKVLFVYGHYIMSAFLFLVAAFDKTDNDNFVVVAMMFFIIVYQFCNGPVYWVYLSEVAVDTALGLCLLAMWLTVFILSLTTNYMMHSQLGSPGMFLMFSLIALAGAVFCHFYIRETKGLNDKEKKNLYAPKELLEQDRLERKSLRPNLNS